MLDVEFVAHFRLQGPDLVLGQTRFRFKTHKHYYKQIQYLHNSLDWECKKAIIFTLDTLKLRVNSNSNSNIMMPCRPLIDIIQTNRFFKIHLSSILPGHMIGTIGMLFNRGRFINRLYWIPWLLIPAGLKITSMYTCMKYKEGVVKVPVLY